MALYIKITKISEQANVGFYHVFTKDFNGANFYIGIDKNLRKIYFYLTNDFFCPVRTVDPNDPNEIVGEVPGANVEATLLAKVFRTAEKVFELDDFPECVDYCA